MLSVKPGLPISLGIFGAIAIAVGCSASGADDGDLTTDPPAHTDPAKQDAGAPTKKVGAPSKEAGVSSSSSSGGSVDGDDDDDWIGGTEDGGTSSSSSSSGGSGPVDAGVDSGPAPDEGASCTTQDTLFTRVCGHCGKQQAICTTNRVGDLKVSEYGPCGGETGVCSTGETQACGKCGTKTCSGTCGWGQCKNEGVCKPGVITHETAGCATVGTYREKACDDTCNFGSFSQCKEPAITVPAQGQVSMTQWELTSAMKAQRPSQCKKTTSLSPATGLAIPLTNPGSTDVTVQIWHSAVNSQGLDTVVATYTNKPSTDSDYKACYTEPQDSCNQLQDICAADGGSGFGGVDNVKVPANSTIWIMNLGWTASTVGKFVLNVKTK
ncbi:MAG: hypothetical protein U0270_46215 [Labilithrix sp.]